MEKIFLIKSKNPLHHHIDVQIPPHEALIDTYLKHMYHPNLKVIVADKSKLPNALWQRAFEDFDDAGNIEIDITKAKKIFMQHLRHKRGRALLTLDQNYCKAYDNKNQEKMSLIEKEKQLLRDLPATFNLENVQTISDLEKMWPSLLGIFGEI